MSKNRVIFSLLIFFVLIINIFTAHGQNIEQLNFENTTVEEIKAGNLTKITAGSTVYREPRISLDGKKIAFRKLDQKGIFVLDLATKQETKIEGSEDSLDNYSWSTDGLKYKDKNHNVKKNFVSNYNVENKVKSIPLKGKLIEKNNEIYLAAGNQTQLIAPWGKNPEFLEDGSIRYEIDEPNTYIVFDGAKREVQSALISYISSKGKEETIKSYYISGMFTISPDGKYLVFSDLKDDGHNYLSGELKIRKIGLKTIKKLLDLNGLIPHSPNWSYDGKKVVFNDDKNGQLYSIDIVINK